MAGHRAPVLFEIADDVDALFEILAEGAFFGVGQGVAVGMATGNEIGHVGALVIVLNAVNDASS